ncbi:hypothetical protein 18India_9 [Salmonella phage 18-India]|nr:hypothetical protein 18India_9 [Salmonella phage 18-India]
MLRATASSIQILTPSQELALAIKIAAEGHLNPRQDKLGVADPYIMHPLKVTHYLKTDDKFQLMAIAALHDGYGKIRMFKTAD